MRREAMAVGFAKRIACAACLALFSPALAQTGPEPDSSWPSAQYADDSIDVIIADYTALERAFDPVMSARKSGVAPTDWERVDPDSATVARLAKEGLLARIRSVPVQTERDRLNLAVLVAILNGDIDRSRHDLDRIPFTGDWGFHSAPVFTAGRVRIRTVEDAEAWIARLNAIPAHFNGHIANMRRGIATGFTAHTDPLSTTIAQIREQAAFAPEDSPLFAPFLTLPEDLPPETAARLRREGYYAVETALSGYADLLDFLETEYAPEARARPGLSNLPGGRAAYRDLVALYTTRSDLSPEDIHAIGQSEVARIRDKMEILIETLGFEGSLQDFITFLRTDPQFYAETPEELIQRAEVISARLRAILPDYFEELPRTPFVVRPVPASIAPGYTTARYLQGDPDNDQPGTYWVNTYSLDQRPLYELPALSAHEAVPGHHLQMALAQELRGLPAYRRNYYATAFGEGWALYTERLAGEAGIYLNPYEEFGALSYEMWRACRLVADTGLHWYDWSREEAEACFIENTALSPLNIENEVTRYIGWPGQALAYKIGELTISDLRAEAEMALGDEFDIKAFHRVVLEQGALPLDLLEGRVEAWIAMELAGE